MSQETYARSETEHHSSDCRPRRGVALLLVLISLGAAGALTSFYLISQENSAAIGTNAEAASASDWAARTGAQLGMAVLETEVDWRTVASADGRIITEIAIGDAIVTVTVTDLEGNPPGESDSDLIVTSMAVFNGLTSIRQMIVAVQPDSTIEESLDEELGEFGIFATDGIRVDDGSLITVWNKSPKNPVKKPANLGAGFALESAFDVDGTSAILRSALYVTNSASSGLKDMVDDVTFEGGGVIPVSTMPVAPALMPTALRDLPVVMPSDIDLNVVVTMRANTGGWQNLRLSDGGEAVLNNDGAGLYRFDEIRVESGGLLTIEGDVELLVTDRLEVRDGGAIHLADDASSLKLYLMGDLDVDNGGIGVDPAVAAETEVKISLVDRYSDPTRMRIFGVSPVSGALATPTYILQDNAIVLASIHAPTAEMSVANESILIGRATTNCLRVTGSSEVYCDPALGVETGFTNKKGPLYKSESELDEDLVAAIDAWDETMGLGALRSELESILALKVLPVELGKIVLGGGGEEEEEEATPRVAGRVVAREWPMRAFAMESSKRPEVVPVGSEVEPGHNDDGTFFKLTEADGFLEIMENLNLDHGSDTGGAKSLATVEIK